MLRFMRRSSRWVMWIVIVGVGAVFVLYLGIGGGFGRAPEADVVVAVGDRHFDARTVLRIRQQQEARLRSQLGDAFDPEAASEFLDQSAASQLLRQALLARAAERMGFTVSDAEVRAYLRRLPGALDEAGQLNRAGITAFAESNYGSLRRFQEALRDEILATKASRRIAEAAAVSEAEAREALRHERTRVRIAFVQIVPTPGAAEELPEEAVDALLEEDPERVRAAYEARRAEFDRPEEVQARHILVKVDEGAPEQEVEAARERIEAIRSRIEEGAAFEDVAREVSEDAGSKPQGGDLGFFPRGRMVPAFEEVAFQLEPGVLSEPVRSAFGFHLIRVEEKRAAQKISFEEARRDVARDLVVQDRAEADARERAADLAAAVREGRSLVDVAREKGLTVERPDPFGWRPDGFVPGLGPAPEVRTAAFALEEDRPSDPTLHEVNGRFVLIQLLEREEPDPEDIEEALPAKRATLRQERRNRIEAAWLTEARDRLQEAGELVYDLSPLRG